MLQVVVQIGSSQYLVTPGQQLVVSRLDSSQDALNFDQVMLAINDGIISIGQPYLEGASVSAKIINPSLKGPKIRVSKYKAKSRYRKARGFRASQSLILIKDVTLPPSSVKKT